MKRIVGFALFFLAIGMLLALLIPNELISIILMLVCLCSSYNLFCCK